MEAMELHDDLFMKIFWDERTRIIGIDWKDATSSMTDEDFKAELTLFAGQVEKKKAHAILVQVANFRHRPGPGLQSWRVQNISTRYSAAGVKRFAFLFPQGAQIPPLMSQSSAEEKFLTRAYDNLQQAETWLTAKSD